MCRSAAGKLCQWWCLGSAARPDPASSQRRSAPAQLRPAALVAVGSNRPTFRPQPKLGGELGAELGWGFSPVGPCPSGTGEPGGGRSRGQASAPSTCRYGFAYCSPGCSSPSWPQGHSAGSKSVSVGSAVTPGVWLGFPKHILVQGLVPPRVQDLALPLGELHEVPASPSLQPVKPPLLGSTTLRRMSLSSRFCATCKRSEGVLPHPPHHSMATGPALCSAGGCRHAPPYGMTCHRRFRNLGGKSI